VGRPGVVTLPGIRLEEVAAPVAPVLRTGVPVFLGCAGAVGGPWELASWPAFGEVAGAGPDDGQLAAAVHGFFAGGGRLCHVVGLDADRTPLSALRQGLAAAAELDAADLVCAPDVMRPAVLGTRDPVGAAVALQAEVLTDCARTGGRLAILDAVPGADSDAVLRQRAALDGPDGALYHPWPWAPGPDGTPVYAPPCGQVAAVYDGTDTAFGVHQAPANAVLEGVLDLRVDLSDADAGRLTAAQVNCLLARPGRGIRVWGARTLSTDPVLRHVAARRVLLTVGRWLRRFLVGTVEEPNDARLRVRVLREVSAYLEGLHAAGALRGRTPGEAFSVRCDFETTPPELAAEGLLVTTVGLALSAPAEFVVLRLTRGASGVTTGPTPTTA
jgi:uncharacterized protein